MPNLLSTPLPLLFLLLEIPAWTTLLTLQTQLKISPPPSTLSKEGRTYITLRIPVAVCVLPSSCFIGLTSDPGLGFFLKSLKVKWVWNSSEYCIKENWEQVPGITLEKVLSTLLTICQQHLNQSWNTATSKSLQILHCPILLPHQDRNLPSDLSPQ